jgi:hypothetical protein
MNLLGGPQNDWIQSPQVIPGRLLGNQAILINSSFTKFRLGAVAP